MIDTPDLSSPFRRRPSPSGVHENPPHDLGRYREKMRPVPPVDALPIHQPKICLIYERRGLKRVSTPLVTHVASGKPAEFVVDDRCKAIQSCGIAVAPSVRYPVIPSDASGSTMSFSESL